MNDCLQEYYKATRFQSFFSHMYKIKNGLIHFHIFAILLNYYFIIMRTHIEGMCPISNTKFQRKGILLEELEQLNKMDI